MIQPLWRLQEDKKSQKKSKKKKKKLPDDGIGHLKKRPELLGYNISPV